MKTGFMFASSVPGDPMRAKSYEQVVKQLTDGGVRASRRRDAVLRAFSASTAHLTVDELYEEARKMTPASATRRSGGPSSSSWRKDRLPPQVPRRLHPLRARGRRPPPRPPHLSRLRARRGIRPPGARGAAGGDRAISPLHDEAARDGTVRHVPACTRRAPSRREV